LKDNEIGENAKMQKNKEKWKKNRGKGKKFAEK
jgi:hypothetical protein